MVHFKALIFIILAIVFLGLSSPVLAQTDQNRKKIIVIDPGHGGKDSGAVGVNGILEKDVVLKIAMKIVELNYTTFNSQHEIYLTRYRDTLISLSDRTKLANTLKANVFISLHCNHSVNPNARGLEVYVPKKQGKYSRESILLAFELQNGLKKNFGFKSRGVKFGNFQVLRDNIEYCPSILLEVAFLSNLNEANFLSTEKNLYSYSLFLMENLAGQK